MTDRAEGQPCWLGHRLRLQVGPVAHGGHCVARHQGRVVFVRHSLPGETVLAEVTEDRGGSFCRADAVEVLAAVADRVPAPCRYAHPGGCGGCDFQHVRPERQRELKAAVIAEQLSRLAGIDRSVTVEPLAPDSLGWRRRIRYAVDPDGRLGLHKHRSEQIVPIERCLIGAPGVGDAPALTERWLDQAEVEIAVDDAGASVVLGHRPAPRRGRSRPRPNAEQLTGPDRLGYTVAGRRFELLPAGFWQTHPAAAETFSRVVRTAAALQPGERALDLYAGAGLFTAVLAEAVGSTGRVLGLEGEAGTVEAARRNLADLPWAEVRRQPIDATAVARAAKELAIEGPAVERQGPDVVVLDPPRTGAGPQVLAAVLEARPRTVIYVACDPAALARDLRTLDAGWQLVELTGYDAYPMTHHVECIAVLRPGTTASK